MENKEELFQNVEEKSHIKQQYDIALKLSSR